MASPWLAQTSRFVVGERARVTHRGGRPPRGATGTVIDPAHARAVGYSDYPPDAVFLSMDDGGGIFVFRPRDVEVVRSNPSRFDRCVERVKHDYARRGESFRLGPVEGPRAICASIGRRAYGEERFSKMAKAGRRNPSGQTFEVAFHPHHPGGHPHVPKGARGLVLAVQEPPGREKWAEVDFGRHGVHDILQGDLDALKVVHMR